MSNEYDFDQENLAASQDEAKNAVLQSVKTTSSHSHWNLIQNDLNKAAQLWESLDAQEKQISPEEQQLLEIKKLIAQVKLKLESFL